MKSKERNKKLIRVIMLLVKWRDEVTTKKKARAIQKVIDQKLKECNEMDMVWLEITEKLDGKKLSAWQEGRE